MDNQALARERAANRLIGIGVKGTKIYLILVFTMIPLASYLGWIEWRAIHINEIGDFLAGIFGPLSIFWLVLGFFQQGEELRNSVEALQLQARELKDSVEQQKAMVGITERQLKLDIETRDEQTKKLISSELPFVQLRSGGSSGIPSSPGGRKYNFRLENFGSDAISVTIKADNGNRTTPDKVFDGLKSKETLDFDIQLSRDDYPDVQKWSDVLTVTSTNLRGRERSQRFQVGNMRPVLLECDPPQ